jgi:threonine dehydrogenase-like Zn-dependent dehydrogenase
MSNGGLPSTQRAVELVGPDQLRLNPAKPIHAPGPHQLLCRVEAVGLCFSDLKLVKQFAAHPRKSEVISGVDREVLARLPSYVPGELPTSPGHEAVVRVVAVGEGVTAYRPGERYLVQADYRWLPTARANAAFGYNFAGALQEYVLFDERVITAPEGESTLLPAPEALAASAVALVEPWGCVEASYAAVERRALKAGGELLVVVEEGVTPGEWRALGEAAAPERVTEVGAAQLAELHDATYDDVLYFGSRPETIESLFPLVAPHGLVLIMRCGERLARPVMTAVGRVHYRGIRLGGTPGCDPVAALACLPGSVEIPAGARMNVVGAGGPMGVMHVVRALSAGVPGIQVFAGDTDEGRLAALARLAGPLAEKHGVAFQTYNPTMGPAPGPFDYLALMVPDPSLVAEAVEQAAEGAIINLFAGIPAEVNAALDLNAYLEKHCYLTGTSGSEIRDMKTVLHKLERGLLDTNLSVAAVGGLEAGIEGIRSVERREIAGKIVLYPSCRGLPLTQLSELQARLPEVAALLRDGAWTPEAERALLQAYETERPKR